MRGNAARSLVPVILVGTVLMMVVPIPPVLLDLVLAVNIALSVVVLLTVMSLTDSLQLSVFPQLLLIATMARLALNVSSTRLILLDGYAGKVIATFGEFVVGGSIIVGLVVFLILVIIQFVVVTSGAGRVAEVAARFSLDAMPGKQMAVDADLSSGLIDEPEARRRRNRIAHEADFFGAMDGASKFVKGDAVAGIVIVVINLVGGFVIGVVSSGMPLSEAITTYSLLTVGDGLVSQIPALMLSVATGLLVTRVGDDRDLGPLLGGQLLSSRPALRVAGAVVGAMALIPGLPKIPFLALGVGLYMASARIAAQAEQSEEEQTDARVAASPDDPEVIIDRMRVEPLELHLAYDALDLIDPSRGGDLLDRVRSLRQQIAMELGIVMPYVRTRDDVSLPSGAYRVMVHGVEVASGSAPAHRALALPSGDGSELRHLGGEETREPVFGLLAYWVPAESRASAAAAGATVVDRSSVVVTHVAEVVRAHAPVLLSRQNVQLLVEGLRVEEPLLAGEVGTETLPVPLLHDVLRGLLSERIGVRDIGRIVEAVAARARETRSVEQLVSAARVAIGPAIVAKIAPERRLSVVTLDPVLEGVLHEGLREVDGVLHLAVDPQLMSELVSDCQIASARGADGPIALVCGQPLRRPLHRTLEGAGVELPVLSYPELPAHLELTPIGVIGNARIDA
jgi:flagellar biosynthesis protein FlhA